MDFGKVLGESPDKFYAGSEYRQKINTFGVEELDDRVPQFIMLYKF